MIPLVGKVGALHVLHQVGQLRLRVVQHADRGIDYFPQVVGRNIGGHAHGDAGGAVDQQIGEPGGQYPGFLPALVEVRVPVHRVLLDLPQHFVGDLGHAGLGVTVGGAGDRRRWSRSFRGRPPGGSAWRNPEPGAPGRRTPKRRHGGGSGPARRPRRWPTS